MRIPEATPSATTVQTAMVRTEGDDLYYEVRGQGAPLLMISGGGGDAGFFTRVVEILSDEYKVITYDRRANSRSTRHAPQNFEISQQSRDAAAVLCAAGESSAYVFGNSGGAVIALDMTKARPQVVRAAVVHEPPVLSVHPDKAKWQLFFSNVYWTGLRFNAEIAMLRFSLPMGIPLATLCGMPEETSKRMAANYDFFIKQEMLAFSNYQPDIAAIRDSGVRVVMAAGKMTLDKHKFYGETAPILAKLLDCEMAMFPGNHLSFIDMPQAWSDVLRGILHRHAC